jgi:hypothetical protein
VWWILKESVRGLVLVIGIRLSYDVDSSSGQIEHRHQRRPGLQLRHSIRGRFGGLITSRNGRAVGTCFYLQQTTSMLTDNARLYSFPPAIATLKYQSTRQYA